jgi:hypothetical protein
MATNQVQIRIIGGGRDRRGKHLLQEGRVRDGQVIWTSEENAKAYIKQGIAEYMGGGDVGPNERSTAGPTETKPSRPTQRKSSQDGRAGQSTDSARSNASAQAGQSSASGAAQASQPSSAGSSGRGGYRPRDAE